ncbi:uncharacterized protein LOC127879682 [Dreissena polymorpha]|uniref:Uncharacterized protein n=1 Tax=Dreissena polymorpha TaxID=45954 RepID=A0A9D4K4V4_DREPO|nr:uncharacterized protein LOC127879682 [Dreissena polymorpha]KAH3833078.1 hypothetical protein DPMN_106379 [Dreissena polymorpha]
MRKWMCKLACWRDLEEYDLRIGHFKIGARVRTRKSGDGYIHEVRSVRKNSVANQLFLKKHDVLTCVEGTSLMCHDPAFVQKMFEKEEINPLKRVQLNVRRSMSGVLNISSGLDVMSSGHLVAVRPVATTECHVRYQVSGTTKYLQVRDDHVVSADQLDGNDEDNKLYILREIKIKDNRMYTTIQIGRDNGMWLQVNGGKITVGETSTHFVYKKNRSDIHFKYNEQYIAYDVQQHTLVLISKDQARQRQRYRVRFTEISVEREDLDQIDGCTCD